MRGVQQLQELQAAALAKGQSLAAEVVKPGTTVLSPLPLAVHGAESALMFQDWLEVTSAIMRDVSEQSGLWWEAVLQEVERSYKVWLAATPLERLNVMPGGMELSEGRWMRLNARVASMFLSAMTVEQRGDMVAHRISTNVVKMLYRLHTVYQPGGLKMLTSKWVDGSPDVAFRTSMLRTSLRLDGQPTMDSVYAYQRHLQAEIETMISSQPRGSTAGAKEPPQVRAIDSTAPQATSPKGRDKERGRSTGAADLCKYFMKPSGCKRGLKCNYSHDMSSLERSVRNKKCLTCGAEGHRQRECTVGKPQAKATFSTTTTEPKAVSAAREREKPAGISSVSTAATEGASDTLSSTGSTVQGVPWTLETLIQAAQQVVHPTQGTASRDVSPEKTKPELKVLHLRDLRVCSLSRSTTALLDSGATHSLRPAISLTEWEGAEEVAVQLAGSHQLVMRITAGGTLLMPYKGGPEDLSKTTPLHPQTIVPMGQLINTLGYTMVWGPDGCVLTSPDGQALRLHVEAGCPQMCEMEALSLIARLEDRKLDQLSNAVVTTQDKVEVAAMAIEQSWHSYLYDYVANGAFESGLRAVRDAPMFEDLPGECLTNLIPAAGLWSGWDIMKNIGFLTRAQRRRFLTSKRWVIHLFAGTEGHWEIMKLDQGDTVVLELDKDRCTGQDLMRNEVWRMLLWGAKEGKIDVIMGGPPGRYQQYAKGGQRDPKYLTLMARMMWLYAVAQVGREINGGSRERNRDVGFIVEYPEGTPQSTREERLRAIAEAEELLRRPGERAGVASWDETRFFWEHVQRHRWELQVGRSTMDGLASFWDTRLWKMFEKEFQMRTVSFDQGLDATSKGTMGKNLRYMLVAKYLVPKKYIEDFSGNTPPEDNGVQLAGTNPTIEEAGTKQVQSPVDDIQTIEEFFKENSGEAQGGDAPVAVEVISLRDGQVIEQLSHEEELDYEPSEPDEEGEDAPCEEGPVGDVLMQEGDCNPPDMSFLTFAVALPNNRSNTVKQALQDIVMYLQMHGMPVYRFHSDKGEFFSNNFRAWLREMGIFGTWSEPSVPQSNGHAESTVRWIKDRTRTLLRSASLPVKLWPVAAAMAAAEQRSKVLNWKSKLAAPFGATVYLRKKAFDKYGPLRRENGLDSKWYKGRYVGLSTIVNNGHLVYIPGNDEEKEKFLHTLHVRADLIEPKPPDIQLVGDDVPKPRRRITSKRDSGVVEMRAVTKLLDGARDMATAGAEEVLKDWSWDRAKYVVTSLAEGGFFENLKFGVYRHGGTVGWLGGLLEFPALTKMLVKMMLEVCPEASFTSILVSHNTQREMHRDSNNDYNTENVIVPVTCPDRGGDIWVELKPGDKVEGLIEGRTVGDAVIYGQLRDLHEGLAVSFNPRRFHEVTEWSGSRTVLIGCTPDCLGKLGQSDLEVLHDYGFPIPLSQLPEFHGDANLQYPLPHLRSMATPVSNEEVSQDSEWAMYLDLSPGEVEIGTSSESYPQVYKTEVTYTYNVEEVLRNLTGPLDVTYTVSPDEVMKNLEAWRPAIMKELKGVEEAIVKLTPGSESRQQWLRTPGVQRLPTKFVFTVKPNDKADPQSSSTWYKSKARLVICGNMATNDGSQVYTETAPAEAVRTALALTSRYRWHVAILDVVAAFLRTPLGRSARDPVVVAQPPRLLEVLGLSVKLELWGLVRALYGLREAPMLWGNFRDDTLRDLLPPRGLRWEQGKTITSWWSIRDEQGAVQALIVVYVDDFMLCGPKHLVVQLGKAIQAVWETSELSFLGPDNSIRFLGMELQRETEDAEDILLFQQGYIWELLRSHGVAKTQLDKVPITKELSINPEKGSEEPESVIRRAQQVTGEAVWMLYFNGGTLEKDTGSKVPVKESYVGCGSSKLQQQKRLSVNYGDYNPMSPNAESKKAIGYSVYLTGKYVFK
ncbi:putative transposon protein [Symbiodinium microadriaticum]|uniref:Putative transposon protein n=1 Tax=Symbiodinium microadriaticum TaxID=2951 RepID=A0A1Q9EYG5_SYMMI|nr:putative transposon protein [Symbiodinium microadriaticum]